MIASSLRKIADNLRAAHIEAAKHGLPIDPDIVENEARRVDAQAEMLERGLDG